MRRIGLPIGEERIGEERIGEERIGEERGRKGRGGMERGSEGQRVIVTSSFRQKKRHFSDCMTTADIIIDYAPTKHHYHYQCKT